MSQAKSGIQAEAPAKFPARASQKDPSQWLQKQWQKRGWWAWLCAPLSAIICLLAQLKRMAYHIKLFKAYRAPMPVIVVGNLSVGGTGKSPLVAHIVNQLVQHGYHPAILTRGYKGKSPRWPVSVDKHSAPHLVGDEAVLLARQTGVPVIAGPDRIASLKHVKQKHSCNIIICDDGFQHLRLARDMDILVLDGKRRYGNGWCLPSGPLREPAYTARTAALIVANGLAKEGEWPMLMSISDAYKLDGSQIQGLNSFTHAHAVAGIGHPERFFLQLEQNGITIIRHAFPDHHHFTKADLHFNDDLPILLTEKDAVKCRSFQQQNSLWVVPVTVSLDAAFMQPILEVARATLKQHH